MLKVNLHNTDDKILYKSLHNDVKNLKTELLHKTYNNKKKTFFKILQNKKIN